MSKSIKLKNDIFIDTTSISHKRERLDLVIENLKPTILFEGTHDTSKKYVDLLDDVSNYKYIEVYIGLYRIQYTKMVITGNEGLSTVVDTTWADTLYIRYTQLKAKDKKILIESDKLTWVYNGGAVGQRDTNSQIKKVVGYR